MRRIIAWALSIVMICMVWPIGVLAEEEQASTDFFGEAETVTNTAIETDFESGANISRIDTYQEPAAETPDEEPETERSDVTTVIQTAAKYESLLSQMMEQKEPELLAVSEDFLNILLKYRLVQKVGYNRLVEQMEKDRDFKTAMEWLFQDYETLQYYVYGGEPDNWKYNGRTNIATSETYLKSFEIFSEIFSLYHADVESGGTAIYSYGEGYDPSTDTTLDNEKLQNKSLCKRLMVAIALTHTSEVGPWNLLSPNRNKYNLYPMSDPVGRYELYKKLYIHNLLIADFDKYNVEELRMVVSVMMDNAQLEWMHYYYRKNFLKNADYLTHPVPATEGNVSGWCNMTYRVFEAWPSQLGGVGDKYYDEKNREEYTQKYTLEMHDGSIFDYKIPYGSVNDKLEEIEEMDINNGAKYYQQQWITIDAGYVCFGVSNTATVLRCAFGIPTVINEEPPNHCAYFEYHHNNIEQAVTPKSNNLTLGIGYDVYGITSASPYFHRHALTGWGNYPCGSVRNGIYMIYGMDAIFGRLENTDGVKHETIMAGMSDYYLKAFNLRLIGDVRQRIGDGKAEKSESGAEEYEKAIELYNKALEVQSGHFPAFIGLADCYRKLQKTDEDYIELAQKAANSNMWLYALPLSDYVVNYLVPLMSEPAKKADVIFITEEKLRAAQQLNSSNCGLAQPSYSVGQANYCLTTMKKVATFTFESKGVTISDDYAGLINGFQFSVDNGSTWQTGTPSEGTHLITINDEDLEKITLECGIQYKFGDEGKRGYIVFTKGVLPVSNPAKNTVDDNNDRILNLEKGLEWKTDADPTWHDLTADSRFEGDLNVHIRRKATGTTLASDEITVEFTKGEGTPELSLVKADNIQNLTVDAKSYDSSTAISCAWDGKNGTYFENNYVSAQIGEAVVKEDGVNKPRQNFDFVFELKEPRYISGLGYLPGKDNTAITGLVLYASADGETWQLADSVDDWEQDKSEKLLELAAPAYAKYIKIHTTAVPAEPHLMIPGITVGHFTVAEFKLYENFAVNDKTPAALSLTALESFKSSYLTGDKPNLAGIRAELHYSDGTTAIIPESALECDVKVFTSTDTHKLRLSYAGVSAEIDVTVNANERVATSIVSVTPAVRKYYAEDQIDTADIEVEVTDGEQIWYLTPDEFTVEGVLREGTNELTVITDGGLEKTFTVNAEKAVVGIEIQKTDEFKTTYSIGDSLDLAGMSVMLEQGDGTEVELSEDEYTLTLSMQEVQNEETVTVPLTVEEFKKVFGTVNMRVALKDKPGVYAEEPLTVLPYITDGNFSFEVIDDGVCKLTEYVSGIETSSGTVTIPEETERGGLKFEVVEIGAGAFDNASGISSVSIPPTIKTINAGAFSACVGLKNVYMIYYEILEGFVCEEGAFADVQNGKVYLSAALTQTTSDSPIPGYSVASIEESAVKMELTPPNKTDYILNETLDETGMVVTAVLNDGSSVQTQHYTVEYNNRKVGKQKVTVKINGTSLEQTFEIDVNFPPLSAVIQPVSGDYVPDAPMEPLTFEATADLNHPLYRWYKCDSESGENAKLIEDAQKGAYTPNEAGYYYAEAYLVDEAGTESEKLRSNVVTVTVSDYIAVTGGKGYSDFAEAMRNVPKDGTVTLYGDAEITESITLSNKGNITLEGNGHTVKRANGLGQLLFILTDKTGLTLRNVTIDGGAKWGGNVDPVLGRGTSNSGLYSTAPMIEAMDQTTLNLSEGAILQNNYNNEINGNQNYYDSFNAAGAVRLRGAAMTINGGIIKNNHAENYASAVYLENYNNYSSSLTISNGEIFGNSMGYNPYDGGGAICLNDSSTVKVTGGEYHNNKSGVSGSTSNGGVFRVRGGNLTISGGEFYENAVDKSNVQSHHYGGVVACNGGTTTITGGTFENNIAEYGGVVAATGSALLRIEGGTFTDNSADKGGVVYYSAKGGGQSSISGAVLKNNTAENGSAVYVNDGAEITLGNALYEGNVAENTGTVWTNGALNINGARFVNNTAQKGQGIYMDAEETLTLSSLSSEMPEIYLHNFSMVSVSQNLGDIPFTLLTDTKITDDTDILWLMSPNSDSWTVNGTINGRALTNRTPADANGAKVRRKPIEGTILSALDGSVIEREDTFDEGFVTSDEGIDLTGCKSLVVTFAGGSEDPITVKYPLSKLFGNRFVNLESVKFGLVIKDIPMDHINDTISIAFTDEEPNSDEVNTMLLKSRNMLGVKMGFDVDIVSEAEQEQKQESKPESESETESEPKTAYKEPEQ